MTQEIQKPDFYVGVISPADTEIGFPNWMTNEEINYIKDILDYGNFTSVMIIVIDGKMEIERDKGEPEDQIFSRDLSWIESAIRRAYEFGKESTELLYCC